MLCRKISFIAIYVSNLWAQNGADVKNDKYEVWVVTEVWKIKVHSWKFSVNFSVWTFFLLHRSIVAIFSPASSIVCSINLNDWSASKEKSQSIKKLHFSGKKLPLIHFYSFLVFWLSRRDLSRPESTSFFCPKTFKSRCTVSTGGETGVKWSTIHLDILVLSYN